ncbi:unnamed protein product [Pleuronectes platessa]|uniref:Alpha-type protein kinase domain-containing protein n=1 Tax=Pleuronectes platessa TaxID=8262 RepID=A0A9N7UDF7_PLEPL|nr:unnamed protein product [Pleuronectes platessa]
MDSQEVGDLLEECVVAAAAAAAAAAAQRSSQPTEAERLNHRSCTDSLSAGLASLLQEAMDMKWPFVPEKWQYKHSVSARDKTNLSDLISKHLPQLLAVLKASIVAREVSTALAVVFLVDRYLYWTDESTRLLKITKLLHRCRPDTPVAPQLVIRQARVYLNSGKLQKAEYILSSLINNSRATGCWVYHTESDRTLVQAVSVQVRGMILQKLGLWLEAAELIWASLVGYYSLPQPDKKGIGTSLGLLANILVSMNDEDFRTFRTDQNKELSLLGNVSHRLLSAAQAAKMAVVYSQYTSLYVLTNVVTQGTCLLSYSFSVECPSSQRQSFLQQAREAFSIGLLTDTEGKQVTSKQELHTFLKAAFSLTVTHKWLGTPQKVVTQATQACHKALTHFYDYCHAASQDKDSLCAEIMHLVTQVKLLLRVEPFFNSDRGSFIPDSYRNIADTSVNFTLAGFSKLMQRFQKYRASLCETTNSNCKGTKDEPDGARLCITALGTTMDPLNTECSTEACKVAKGTPQGEEPHLRDSDSSAGLPPQHSDQSTTQGSTDELGSSWQNFSLSGSGSSWPSSSGYVGSSATEAGAEDRNQNFPTTEVDDSFLLLPDKNMKRDLHVSGSTVNSRTVPRLATPATSSSNSSLATPHPNLQCASTEPSTASSFDIVEMNEVSSAEKKDYRALLAGVCHDCLMKRLHNDETQFKLKEHRAVHSALHLKFSKAQGLWTARETCVYIGEPMGKKGKQRAAIWVQFLHQEERLSSYVGKDYLKPKQIQFHLGDVERQMTAQYYVTEFNKSLYDRDVMAQIYFIPSEALLILDGDEIVGCVSVEPYMLGDFVKLTNNTGKKDKSFQATEYGLAFGHFTYIFSDYQEVVVDLQGWVTANGKGLTYLTDPQIHSTRTPRGPSNFAARGLRYFLEEQHGPECNGICQLLQLAPVVGQPHVPT